MFLVILMEQYPKSNHKVLQIQCSSQSRLRVKRVWISIPLLHERLNQTGMERLYRNQGTGPHCRIEATIPAPSPQPWGLNLLAAGYLLKWVPRPSASGMRHHPLLDFETATKCYYSQWR